jgi:lysophospholipase L1-like esterase
MKKRILVFSDSNGWGYTPGSGERLDENSRWPAILDSLLPGDCQVIEDCANGRTIAFDDPICEYRNGIKQIGASLYCNNPVDLLVIMLGINDVRYVYNARPPFIARALQSLAEKAFTVGSPGMRVLIVTPPTLRACALEGPLSYYYDEDSVRSCEGLAPCYEATAKKLHAHYFDASAVSTLSGIDGVHLNAENHRKLAKAILPVIANILDVTV